MRNDELTPEEVYTKFIEEVTAQGATFTKKGRITTVYLPLPCEYKLKSTHYGGDINATYEKTNPLKSSSTVEIYTNENKLLLIEIFYKFVRQEKQGLLYKKLYVKNMIPNVVFSGLGDIILEKGTILPETTDFEIEGTIKFYNIEKLVQNMGTHTMATIGTNNLPNELYITKKNINF